MTASTLLRAQPSASGAPHAIGKLQELQHDTGADQLALLMEGSPSMSSRSKVSRPRSHDTYRSPRVRKQACTVHVPHWLCGSREMTSARVHMASKGKAHIKRHQLTAILAAV